MSIQILHLVWNLPPLVYVAIALLTLWYWMRRSKLPDNIPPFPVRPYPILGHMPWMKKGAIDTFHEWRQTTGDIYSIYLGQNYSIVINTMDMVKEALVKQADIFSDRSPTFSDEIHGTKGIVFSSGQKWKEQRSVSTTILKDFGMGKNILATKISQEVEAYLTALSELKGEPTDVRLLTNASVANVIFAILTGESFKYNDPKLEKILRMLMGQMELSNGTSILNTLPWLRHLPFDFFDGKKLMDYTNRVNAFYDDLVKETRESNDGDVKDNFIYAYIDEMEKRKIGERGTFLDEPSLTNIVADLFSAGSDTTSTTLVWAVLLAIRHPDIQEKVYQEIIDVAGTDRPPSIQDKPRLPYTNAFIMEVQRFGNIAPFSIFRMCAKTTTVAGYTIPKDTTIISNLHEILSDEKTWGDPMVFRPERFLDKDNKLSVPDEFIPFSVGRRNCMGQSLAKMELYLYVCGIFQRFHIQPERPGELPPTDYVMGLTCSPKPFKTRMIERMI